MKPKAGGSSTRYWLFAIRFYKGDGAEAPKKNMARQDQANDQFSVTSFLYGGNADYIEQLHSAWQENPDSVDPEWQGFFASLKDDAGDVR